MSLLNQLKGVSSRDQKMIAETEAMFGPEPEDMGFMKNLFWGRIREELVFPYPEMTAEQRAKTDQLLAELNDYLENEHPTVQIDQEEEIPEWAIARLFEIGVLGMTIPEEYGGLGLGVASYNEVLEAIGKRCGSTGVMVSAHQSIGCKALMLFGTEEQKKEYLPRVAREYLSAFCLSEPNVGSDAGGQETTVVWDEQQQCYILNGEKKWSTSGALAGLFTVMAKHRLTDPKTGKERDGVTALILTPDMEGIDIFQNNRSKTGIRGTWQARIRFNDVKVPKNMLLHKEGQGLKVALTCLNYGRCTLSAGVTGAAKVARDQAAKWTTTRYQFQRPLADFELVQERLAYMAAYTYAMDAMLYMTCGMLDRHDPDIMVETAACKYFCSEYGWNVIDAAMQVMGGEGYVTENEFERTWRDNRIHRIVEGSNELMQSFVFAYGGKQLAEHMLGVLNTVDWSEEESFGENLSRIVRGAVQPATIRAGTPLAREIFLGIKVAKPRLTHVNSSLTSFADRLSSNVQRHTRAFKLASKKNADQIVGRQCIQARLANNAILLYAWTCVLSKLDKQMHDGASGAEWQRDMQAAIHFMNLAHIDIDANIRALDDNADESMRRAAQAAIALSHEQPHSDYIVPESSPVAAGQGREPASEHIKQFPGDSRQHGRRSVANQGDGASTKAAPSVESAGDSGGSL
ncbi:acyl-CoA dehydrogenase family protein [soil metagenome]